MPKLFRPAQIIKQTLTTSTTQGEVTVNINLHLTLSLDESGQFVFTAAAAPRAEDVKKPNIPHFEIPDFTPTSEIIEGFGEDVD